jgi:hypothetical protein
VNKGTLAAGSTRVVPCGQEPLHDYVGSNRVFMFESFKNLFTNLFGSWHERQVKKLQPLADDINAIVERLQSLSEGELKGQTEEFRGPM